MTYRYKIITILFLVSTAIFFGIYFLLKNSSEVNLEILQKNKLNKLETHYNIFMHNQILIADTIFNETINRKGLVDIYEKAKKTKDKDKLNILRKKVLKMLEQRYKFLKKMGILQYHFVFENNISFLRLHKKNKFGDDLTNIREDYEYTNKHKEIIRGFSHGRTAHGFRNVYPVFSKKGQYIGALEVSFSSESLQKSLTDISKINSHFLLSKKIFDTKTWGIDDTVLEYKVSLENSDYMVNILSSFYNPMNNKQEKKIFVKYKQDIKDKMNLGKAFSIAYYEDKKLLAISFLPIKQNITKNVVAWIVSYENIKIVPYFLKYKYYIIFSLISLLLFISYFIYEHLINQKIIIENDKKLLETTNEQKTLLSLFDIGNSVLFQWENSAEYKVKYVSSSVEKLLNYKPKEFFDDNIRYLDCIHKDDREKIFTKLKNSLTLNKDNYTSNSYRVISKDKKEKWVLEYIVFIRNEKDRITSFIGYIVDITEEKNKDALLFSQSKHEAMGEMIVNIAHQWRQPLSTISTSATGLLLLNEYKMLTDDKLQEVCASINESTQYLSQTIDDFANFIKDDRVLEEFRMDIILNKFIHFISPSLDNNKIKLDFKLDYNPIILGYPNELQQVFLNIFNNAKDAINQNVENDEDKLYFIKTTKNQNMLDISFKDSAGGISKDIINSIFEPYFSTKHKSKGKGLGLYIAYKLITEGVKGNIKVSNEIYNYKGKEYKGAEFIVSIPLKIT